MQEITVKKDIFISYRKKDGEDFAKRLYDDLTEAGYSVFWFPEEKRSSDFPEDLQKGVRECKDFLIILSESCLAKLLRDESVDWVREELLLAHELGKNIVPILMEGVTFPESLEDFPERIRFLGKAEGLRFFTEYKIAPFMALQKAVKSRRDGKDRYRDAYNSNPGYNVTEDYLALLQKAREGDVEAMYEVGMMCFYGAASEKPDCSAWDYDGAAFWLKKVAASDSDLRFHAESILGRMYYQGLIPREVQSYENAYKCHCRAAEGDDFSARERAFLMRIGAGCEYDFNKILDYYHEVADKGDDESNRALAMFLAAHGKFQEALDIFDSMENLSPESEYQIGLLYMRGVHTDPPKPDYIQASYHLRTAADQNHLLAAHDYATMCLRPTGRFKKNFAEAEKYFKISADGGYVNAQAMLGYMYRSGVAPGGQNLPEAIRYLEMAREQNHTQAALELASIYQQPGFLNYGRAYACAELVASHGMAEGELILGNLLLYGRGCEPDVNRAYEMYEAAYRHGLYYASVMMRKIEKMTGTEKL